MRKTKKLTISAVTVALGVLFMSLGAVFSVLDLSASALSSMLVAFAYFELGSPYTWLIWLSTALLSFVFFPGSLVWLTYLLVFGIYPILKGYIERLPRIFFIPLKIVFVNAMMAVMLLFAEVLTGQSFFGDVTAIPFDPTVVYAVLWVMLNVAFFLYDRLLVVLSAFYAHRIRPKIQNLLK